MIKWLTDKELAEIEQRTERATPGPWKSLNHWKGILYKYVMSPKGTITGGIDWYDAEFIAHAREDIPLLIAETRRLRKALHEIANVDEGHSSIDCNIMRDLARSALGGWR